MPSSTNAFRVLRHPIVLLLAGGIASAFATHIGHAQERAQSDAIYQAVVAGMSCKQSTPGTPQLDCTYTVGRGVAFVIAGVGEPDAAITVTRATGYESDFYVTIGLGHGCVIVKPGRVTNEAALKRGELPRMAFVSPVDGKVYRTWQECGATRKRRCCPSSDGR